MSFCGLKVGMETPAPLVNGIVTNALFDSIPVHINQTLHKIIHILPFCLMDSLMNYALDFVVSWIEVRAVRLPQILKFIWVTIRSLRLLHFRSGGSECGTDCSGKHSMQKKSQPE